MSYCTWLTHDTHKPVYQVPPIVVYMHTRDGRTWREANYQGEGLFGGKSYWILMSELNGPCDKGNPCNNTKIEHTHTRGVDIYDKGVHTQKIKGHSLTTYPILTSAPFYTGHHSVPNKTVLWPPL